MIKILFLQKTNAFSGAENIVISIIQLLPKNNFECIYVSPEGTIRNYLMERNIIYYPLKDASLKSIKQAVKAIRPDIIHATDYGMSSYVAHLGLDIPIVAHLHNNTTWLRNPIYPKTIFFALSLPKIDQVISVSPSIENEFVYRKLLSSKNHIIFNAVDLEKVGKLSKEINDIENVEVGFLGRLTPQKNPLLFCEIIKKYKEINPSIKAMIVGDGELKEEVQNYIKDNELTNNIKMYGFQKNPYKYINKCKVLVMPSGWEGFGLAAVEALSLGKPVLCSGVGGLKDIVNDDCGKICNDINEYVSELKSLLSNDELYKMKSKNAMLDAKQFGNMDDYIEKIAKVYGECRKKKY